MKTLYTFTSILLCTAAQAVAGGNVAYVDDDAPVNGDGQSWATAYRYLQDAVSDAAASDSIIDEVRVAQGTYRPDLSEYGHATMGDVLATFQLVDDLSLLGGYAGLGAPDPDERDVEVYKTTLTGDLNGNDGDDFTNMADNSAHVLTATGVTAAAVVDGFTVNGGNAFNDDVAELELGGGIVADPGIIAIRSCTFHRNRADYGGAVYIRDGSASIDGCTFLRNEAVSAGGALRMRNGDQLVCSNSTFLDNQVGSGKGGGIAAQDAMFTHIADCHFEGNSAGVGGAFGMSSQGQTELVRCTIVDNTASAGAGGGNITGPGVAVVDRCVVRLNHAAVAIGGLAVGSHPQGVIANSIFAHNSSGVTQGGLVAAGVDVYNCLIYGNSSDAAGGVLAQDSVMTNCVIAMNSGNGIVADGNLTIHNSILWNNTPEQVGYDPVRGGETPTIEFSCIQNGFPGTGNIDANPMFVQAGGEDFRLAHDSPCINAGVNGLLPADFTDLDGDGNTDEAIPYDLDNSSRVQNGTVDMGAYEGAFDPMPPAATIPDFDPGQTYAIAVDAPSPSWGESVSLLAWNNSDVENATLTITDLRGMPGRTESSPLARIETNVPHGQMSLSIGVPITATDFIGIDPYELDLTVSNQSGQWLLAPALNHADSPGYDEPIGDRHVTSAGPATLPTIELGDYGVHWNADTQQGFLWANVDHPGEFGMRLGLCGGDGFPYGGDHIIDVHDLLGLLANWGADNRWFDVDGNGLIDQNDLIDLAAQWGSCSP